MCDPAFQNATPSCPSCLVSEEPFDPDSGALEEGLLLPRALEGLGVPRANPKVKGIGSDVPISFAARYAVQLDA